MLPPVSTVRDLYDMLHQEGKSAAEFMDIGGISLIIDLLNRLFKEYASLIYWFIIIILLYHFITVKFVINSLLGLAILI